MLRKEFKYIILLLAELLLILFLLPGCLKKEENIYSLCEEIDNFLILQGDSIVLESERISMEPGVYQVRVYTDSLQAQYVSVEMKGDDIDSQAIKSNGVAIFSGCVYTDFEVYITGNVSTAYIQCISKYLNGGIDKIEIYKTNWGNRILLFWVCIALLVLDGAICFRKAILEKKIKAKQQVVFFALLASTLLAYYPFMRNGFFLGYDSTFHLSRIAFLKDSLLQGLDWPIRIQSTWLYDHGYAVSLFYGDLFLLFPACLMLIGFSLMSSYKIFVFCALATTSIISYFSLKKCVKDEYAALFGSLIYLLSPYFLLDIYNRGAVGEFLAMVFLPLVVCGVYLLFTENINELQYKNYKWYVVWGMSGILQSHLLSTEMAAIFIAIACVVFWKRTIRKNTFLELLKATGIVLLINAWYWVPLVYMLGCDTYGLQVVNEADVQSRGLSLAELIRIFPDKDKMLSAGHGHEAVQIGTGILILLVFYIIWLIRKNVQNKACSIFAVFCILAMVFCTQYVPWNNIMDVPGLGFVVASLQFPWRWMSLATVFGTFFASFGYSHFNADKWGQGVIGVALTITIFLAAYQGNSFLSTKELYLYEEENFGTIQVVSGEYLLEGVNSVDYFYHEPIAEEGLLWFDYEKNGTEVLISLANVSEEMKYMDIPLTGYKGYEITVLEGEQNIIPSISQERGGHGDLRIEVPKGYNGKIQISYKGFPIFYIAQIASVITMIGIFTSCFYGLRKSKKNEK